MNAATWLRRRKIALMGTFAAGALLAYFHGNPVNPLQHAVAAEARGSRPEAAHGGRKVLYWWDPMMPDYRSDKPGKSPMGMDMVPVYADEGSPGQPGGDAGAIRIAPEVVNNLGVRTTKAERGVLSRHIDTVGYIGVDESRIGHVHLRTEGWVEQLAVHAVGDLVAKGQLLFTLYSPTLVNGQQEYVQALEVDDARLIDASRRKLENLGVSAGQIDSLTRTRQVQHAVGVFAHHAGVVTDLKVRAGMNVDPTTETLTLVDLQSVWLLAEVFERQADWVRAGQQAEARIESMPGRIWRGTVEYVYPSLDPVTRTLKVRLRFDNPDAALKPNMFADVSILAEPRSDVLSVPREAVIRDGSGERVIVALGSGKFAPRDVRTGIESGERVEILDGLAGDEEVVVSAQFLLDSEASLRGSFERMSPAAGPDASGKAGATPEVAP